jgi:hypothetical protein
MPCGSEIEIKRRYGQYRRSERLTQFMETLCDSFEN